MLTREELDRLSNEVLSALEIREARLLNWGFINGAQTLDDLDRELPELLRPMCENSAELGALWERAKADGRAGADLASLFGHPKMRISAANTEPQAHTQ